MLVDVVKNISAFFCFPSTASVNAKIIFCNNTACSDISEVAAEAPKAAGTNPTRDSFRAALNSLSTDVGGFQVSFKDSNHSGSKKVWMTMIKGGKIVPVIKM